MEVVKKFSLISVLLLGIFSSATKATQITAGVSNDSNFVLSSFGNCEKALFKRIKCYLTHYSGKRKGHFILTLVNKGGILSYLFIYRGFADDIDTFVGNQLEGLHCDCMLSASDDLFSQLRVLKNKQNFDVLGVFSPIDKRGYFFADSKLCATNHRPKLYAVFGLGILTGIFIPFMLKYVVGCAKHSLY